jgi:2-hydroxychromene-2-carboxylate isomerase
VKPSELSFWFDYSCPYAYLASTQVEALAARSGARLAYEPMLLGGVFRAVGTAQNLMNVLSPAKAAHNARDMQRWAELFHVPLAIPEGHPLRTVEALRATLLAGCDPRVIHGFFRAYWVEGSAPSSPEVIRRVLADAGHDASAVLARLDDASVKDDLRARTDRAIALGIFGAPAYVVSGNLYWGQDRAHFVEAALRRDASSAGRTHASPAKGTSFPMAHTLEVYFDFSSPFAYLGCAQVDALAARTGATVVWRPFLLGGLFKALGQVDVPLVTWSEAKRTYTFTDMVRWAAHWNIPFRWPTRFPMNSIKALRIYLALPDARRAAFRDAAFRAYWAEDRDLNDDAVLRGLLGEGADEVFTRTQAPEIKAALKDATEQAVSAGVFGAPTFVIDGKELFWGQDRLGLVEAALLR